MTHVTLLALALTASLAQGPAGQVVETMSAIGQPLSPRASQGDSEDNTTDEPSASAANPARR